MPAGMMEGERDDQAAYESNLSKGQKVEVLVLVGCQTLGFKPTEPSFLYFFLTSLTHVLLLLLLRRQEIERAFLQLLGSNFIN